MADEEQAPEGEPKKKKGKFIVVLLVLLIMAGAGGAVGYLGLINMSSEGASPKAELPSIENIAFLELPQLIVPMGESAKAHHLRAQFSIETEKQYLERLEQLKPRLIDMMNTYLRAVDEEEIIDPTRFQRLQIQMLRRAKLVAGDEAVKNILIQEFVLQ